MTSDFFSEGDVGAENLNSRSKTAKSVAQTPKSTTPPNKNKCYWCLYVVCCFCYFLQVYFLKKSLAKTSNKLPKRPPKLPKASPKTSNNFPKTSQTTLQKLPNNFPNASQKPPPNLARTFPKPSPPKKKTFKKLPKQLSKTSPKPSCFFSRVARNSK